MDTTPRHFKTLLSICCGTILSASASAALTINNQPSYGTARIGMGGADSLTQAKTIMYTNNNGITSTTTVRKIDNGYNSSTAPNNYSTSANTAYTQEYNNYNNNYYDQLAITTGSRGVMVMDLTTNTPIYEKNADIARPIASITKLMTAMVLLDSGQNMSQEIVLEPIDFVGPKRASSRLKSGDRMNRAELILMMLMKSENPAAKSLARHYPGGYDAFMAAMNRKAQSLGMTSAFFGDPTGLDKRNVASPSDLVKMVKAAGNYEVIRRFSTTRKYDFFVANYAAGSRSYPASNTNYLVRDGIYPIGISKTGYINEAGKCVVMETLINNRPAVIVLLGANSSATRWNDAETILNKLSLRRSI
ncbi:serine hydrolase [Psychrobacter sp. I-STPA10]|uniref:serine hydrolase n=1 Tax=Psychrobacter sp. I-STPA10 TaxID=2585769 RepID=UPI001E46228D|nr:serine hydrolase [Psychrobacter sp. I-STPA10]